ncbi:unnamed protein product [Mytilus coruscus]|uniref:C1q domain-containing protein n=1 Tax=Mytilus coruscus TaxID=42192 RepID=A0A6J8CNQ0_MYTCO|nr:unnamed protein product [Mytilus coruscus]
MTRLKFENEMLKDIIKNIMTKITYLEDKINETVHNKRVTTTNPVYVAFHANVAGKVSVHDNEVLHFQKVNTNLETAYNGNTGVFESPSRGYYVFFVHFLTYAPKTIEAVIVKNGASIQNVYAGTRATGGFGTGSNLAIVELMQGDRVWVKVHDKYHDTIDVLDGPWSDNVGDLTKRVDVHETEMTRLKSENEMLKDIIKNIMTKITYLEDKINGTVQNKRVSTTNPVYVAFHANVAGKISVHDNEDLHFQTVNTNLESAYNGSTGVFESPSRGYYVFFVHFLTFAPKTIEAVIVKNSASIQNVYAGSRARAGYGTGSNLAIVELMQRDRTIQAQIVKNGVNIQNVHTGTRATAGLCPESYLVSIDMKPGDKRMGQSHPCINDEFIHDQHHGTKSDGNDKLLERMNKLETLMMDLMNDNEMLKEKVSSLQTENEEFKNTISFLKNDNEVFKRIANGYYSDAKHGNETFHNKRITVSNRVFQSPTTGFYVFIVNFLSLQSKYIEAQIIRNGVSIQDVYAGDETHFGFGSNIAIVELEKGDRVWVKVDRGFHDTGSILDGPYCAFAGFLLYPSA